MVNLAQPGSLWQRLKSYCMPRTDQNPDDERRGWGRFRSAVETTFRPANVEGAARLKAGIRNIARRGVALLVDRAFEAGDLLNVDVPGQGDELSRDTALACVVYVMEQAPDTWILGCVFSADLSDDNLAAFGAEPGNAPMEQRTRDRHRCELQATCQQVAETEQPLWEAQVQNISPLGVGLLSHTPIEAGTLLNVQLRNPLGETLPTLLACVVHTTTQPTGDWLLGCNFMRNLCEDEMACLRGS